QDGENYLGEDTDCYRLRQALGAARNLLNDSDLKLNLADKRKIEGRYRQIEEVADAISMASKVGGPFRNRVADILAGFAGPANQNLRVAALLIFARFEAGRTIAGNASACQFVLSLPEQIYRTWALWNVALNYYKAPAGEEEAWNLLERE